MYIRKKILFSCVSPESHESEIRPFCKDVRISRSLSYYLRGGLDLDGVMNRKPVGLTSDTSEDISSGSVDMFTDARVSRLDIASKASEYATDSIRRAAADAVDV